MVAADLSCPVETKYCVRYHDGNLHNIIAFEVLVMTSSILAVLGYRKARSLYIREREESELNATLLGESHLL